MERLFLGEAEDEFSSICWNVGISKGYEEGTKDLNFQGNYGIVTMKRKEADPGIKKFRPYKEQERHTDGEDKSKRTREKRKQRKEKRDMWEGWDV